MPCNCDHLEASALEREVSRVQCLLDELDGRSLNLNHWDGYHPKVYNKVDRSMANRLTSELCHRLKTVDVKKFSLEMQMWWRDHQAADKKRLQDEATRQKTDKQKAAALAKLTPQERRLLGL